MKHIVYLTTNLVNGKRYVGKHKVGANSDSYLGSGIRIKSAIAKYGRENFKRQILHECSSDSEANELERQEIQLKQPEYNLHPGGSGGWSHVNDKTLDPAFLRSRAKLGRQATNAILAERYGSDWRKHLCALARSEKARQIKDGSLVIKRTNRGLSGERNGMYGKSHTKQTRERMSTKKCGKKNSQHGKKWVTNGLNTIPVRQAEIEEYLSKGYRLGRTL